MPHRRPGRNVDISAALPYRLTVAEKPSVHPLVRLIWKIEQARGRFWLPVGNTAGGILFYARPLLANTWSLLLQAMVREPALRFRCARIGKGLRLYGPAPQIMGDGTIEIGDDVEFSLDTTLLVGLGLNEPARLSIGNDVRVGSGNTICVAREVRIGNHCRTGQGVKIYDTDLHAQDPAIRRENYGAAQVERSAPIMIDDDAWIGDNAVILKGVTLHQGAIVGAGAVVTDDVPPNTIVAGNPARIVRRLTSTPGEGSDVPGTTPR